MDKSIAANILGLFGMVESPKPELVSIITTSNPMPHNDLSLITYGKHRYMILQDDSATSQHEYVQQMFEESMLIPSTGHVVRNPEVQPDGEQFAIGSEGKEYYLWSYDKDE
jgi:hypothetical protein